MPKGLRYRRNWRFRLPLSAEDLETSASNFCHYSLLFCGVDFFFETNDCAKWRCSACRNPNLDLKIVFVQQVVRHTFLTWLHCGWWSHDKFTKCAVDWYNNSTLESTGGFSSRYTSNHFTKNCEFANFPRHRWVRCALFCPGGRRCVGRPWQKWDSKIV